MQLIKGKIQFLLLIFFSVFIGLLLLPGEIIRFTPLASRLAKTVEKELTQALSAQVKIKRVGLSFLSPEFTDIEFQTLEGHPLLSAEKIRIGVDWIKLLTHHSLVGALRELELTNSSVWIRKDGAGKMEVLSLFPETEGETKGEIPRITIRLNNCNLNMEMTEENWSWGDFRRLQGVIDLRSYPVLRATAKADSQLDPGASAQVEFQYSLVKRSGQLQINATDTSAAFWGEKVFKLLGYADEFKVEEGKLRSDLSFIIQPDGLKLDYTKLVFTDSRWKVARLPYPVENFNADLTISSTGIEVRRLKTQYNQGQVSLNGRLLTVSSTLDLNLYATSLQLADWTSLLPELEIGELSGAVDLNLKIKGKISKPHLQGEIRMDGGSLTIPGLKAPLKALRVLAKISGEDLNFSYLEGRMEEAPFFIKGTISGFKDPKLNLNLAVKHFQPDRVFSQRIPVTSQPVDGAFHITGRLSAPALSGELSTKKLTWKGETFKNLKVAGDYRWKTDYLNVNQLEVGAFGGKASAFGEIINLTSTPVINVEAKAEAVNLAPISEKLLINKKIPRLTGSADLNLELSGPLSNLAGDAELEITEGTVNQFAYERLQLYLSGDHKQINSRIFLNENGGKLIAAGFVQPQTGDYQGDFLARKIKFDPRWAPGEGEALKGFINGSLRVEGNLKEREALTGDGWLEIHDLAYHDQELGVLKLRGQANAGQIQLSDSCLLTKAGQLTLSGEVGWQEKPYYDLVVNGDKILLADIMTLFPKKPEVDLEGLADLRLRVNGWEKPLLQGDVLIDDLILNGNYLEQGKVSFCWKDALLSLDDLSITSSTSRIGGRGSISRDGELDLQVESEKFPLESLEQLGARYLENPEILSKISGSLSGKGRLRGTLKTPLFEGYVSLFQPKIAGFNLDQVAGELCWKEKILFFDEMLINRAAEELTVYGKVDFTEAQPYLDLGFKMEEASISNLLVLAGRSPQVRIDGKVTGFLRMLGRWDQPLLRLIAQFKEGEINGFTPLSGELDLQIQNSNITVNRLIVDEAQGEFFVTGAYIPGSQLQISAKMREFPIAPLIGLTGREDLPREGRVDLQLELETTAEGMKGEFDALLKDTSWGGIKLSSLGLAGQLHDDLVLLAVEDLGANRLSIQGTLPLNQEWFGTFQLPTSWPHRNSQIDLGISAEKVEASALNALFSEPLISAGTIDGLISLNGNWKAPYLVGSLTIVGGKGKISSLPEEFRDVNGELHFSNKGLKIRGLKNKDDGYVEGRLGSGRFRLGGSIISNGLELKEFNLNLKGDNLHLAQPFLDGLVSGELALTGSVAQPVLRGQAVLKKARVGVPEATGGSLPFDLKMDLNLQAANDVYFRMYGMAYIPFTGRMHVGGSLSKPELTGEFNSSRGWVNFMGDTFRIKHLKAEFRPDYKLYPLLEMEASRYLAGTEVTLATQGWSGDFDSLVINPSSNPPMSREEILKLLNWPEKIDDVGVVTFSNMFQENINMVGDLFIGRFLDQFRSLVPIDFLTLEQDRQEGTFWMNMGKSLSEDLYLSYSRTLTSLAEQVWTLEWKLLPNISLLGDYSANEGLRWQLQYNLRF